MTDISISSERGVDRPLSALVPLIKAALHRGVEAYAEAGGLLIEAKAKLPHGEYEPWVKQNFDIGLTQAKNYVKLHFATVGKQNGGMVTGEYTSLRDFQRRHLGQNRPTPVHPQAWHGPVKESLGKVDLERFSRPAARAVDERTLQKNLALKLIDIGFKALATKLHPDQGGSKEAMTRLNNVRARLKVCAERMG